MLDGIFTDELLLAVLVGLVHAHDALGQWHAQLVLLLVLQIQVHADLLILEGFAQRAAEVLRRAEQDQLLVERDVRGRKQTDLLLLLVQ